MWSLRSVCSSYVWLGGITYGYVELRLYGYVELRMVRWFSLVETYVKVGLRTAGWYYVVRQGYLRLGYGMSSGYCRQTGGIV